MMFAAIEAMAQAHSIRMPRGNQPNLAAQAAAGESIHAASPPCQRSAWTMAKSLEKENGSPGLIRTGGRPINSRMLYR